MSNGPDNQQEGSENPDAEIVLNALKKVENARAGADSYFGMIPADYQHRVDKITTRNFPLYKDQFAGNIDRFREAVAWNWLVKKEAFALLAEANGMTFITDLSELEGDPNDSKYAILTESGSYLMAGEGAFDENKGAAFRYVTIPLRGADLQNFELEKGRFDYKPKVGHQAYFSGIHTSRVIAMYASGPEKPQLESDTVNRTFVDVDAKTLF